MITTDALNGLLAIRNDSLTARWNFKDALGTSVSNPGGVGNSVSIGYDFLSSVPAYYAPGDISGFLAFNNSQQQAARDVLASIASMIGVNFIESANLSSITLGLSSQVGNSGYAYYPAYSYSWNSGTNLITDIVESDLAGDVWLNGNTSWSNGDFLANGDGYGTLIHEIGHALGLKHPFEGNYTLDAGLDNTAHTMMSYTQAPFSLYRTVTQTGGGYSMNYRYIQPETLMPYDIEALQYLYGANTGTNTGDDVYSFDPSRPFFKTLWDAGGNDTISVENFLTNCIVNLNPGSYSSIAIPSDLLPPGVIENNTNIYDGTDNLAIAFNVAIENAIGGQGNDSLIGSGQDNKLLGGMGNDSLSGGLGNDFIDGGMGVDRAVFSTLKNQVNRVGSSGDGRVLIVDSASGHDYLQDMEEVDFGDTEAMTLQNFLASTPADPLFAVSTANQLPYVLPNVYSGPVASLQYELLGSAAGDIIGASDQNDFLNLLGGDDAVDGGAGNDVLDGGGGSNFLTGGAGRDVFFVDGRGGLTTWSTISDWQTGEQLAIWGWQAGVSTSFWADGDGAIGFKGATLHADLNGDGMVETSITWTGLTQNDLPTPVAFSDPQLLWFL